MQFYKNKFPLFLHLYTRILFITRFILGSNNLLFAESENIRGTLYTLLVW
jgi:hypothetical protein